jgi:hypothetical protein
MPEYMRPAPPAAAKAIELSDNAKLGPMSATYVSQQSCPPACPFRGNGCYGEHGLVGLTTRRLNRAGLTQARDIARQEARAIDRLSGVFDLRLHVVGDARTASAARELDRAAKRYRRRGRRGSKVFTFSHAWADVPRKAWGAVSVLASCETAGQVLQARARGYAAALVVPEFRQEAAYDHEGLRLLPCPYETRGVKCVHCRLCMDDARLRKAGLTIGFVPHGHGKEKARLALPVLADERGAQ